MFDFSHLGGMGGIMSMLPQMQTPSNFLGNMINNGQSSQLGQMADGQGGGGLLSMLGHNQLGPALAQAFPGMAQGWNMSPTGVASGASGGDMGGGPTGAPWGGDIQSMMNHPMMLSMLHRFGLGNGLGNHSFLPNFQQWGGGGGGTGPNPGWGTGIVPPGGGPNPGWGTPYQPGQNSQNGFALGGSSYQT